MRSLLYRLVFVFALLGLAATAAAQQSDPAKQRPPRLTTDDVRPLAGQPAPETKEVAAKPEDAAKTDAASKTDQPKQPAGKVSEEESSWRDRVGRARSRAKDLERAAEEGELRITALRNDLGTSGRSPQYRNGTVAELDQAGQRLAELRTQARSAAADAEQLAEYGRQKGFSEAEGPKATSEEGKPNEEYYRAQFAKLTEAFEGAQRRVQLYNDRVSDLTQKISGNSGGKDRNGHATGGDSFFVAQLQKDRDDAQQKLDEARAAQTQAQNDLDALKEEARRAGVPPGLFR